MKMLRLWSVFKHQMRVITCVRNTTKYKGMMKPVEAKVNPCLPIVEEWRKKFKKVGLTDTEKSLKAFMAHVLNLNKHTMPDYSELSLSASQQKEFENLCQTRHARMPLEHILGEAEFMGMDLKVTPSVFVPRPLTEEFVKTILDNTEENESTMLEVGCGTGAISLAMLRNRKKLISAAIERCALATSLAVQNGKRLGYNDRFFVYHHSMEPEDMLPKDLKSEKFDMIVSNPPCARPWEYEFLPPEVTMYENMHAISGGQDGLAVARVVIDLACKYLRNNGTLWLEVGTDHPQVVRAILKHKYQDRLLCKNSYKDKFGHERFVEIEKLPQQTKGQSQTN